MMAQPGWQEAAIQDLTEWLAQNESVRALAVFGTVAQAQQDLWSDVDLLSEHPVRVYRASDPEQPTLYRRGEIAEAEPALPGWRIPVDDLFRKPAQEGGVPTSPRAS